MKDIEGELKTESIIKVAFVVNHKSGKAVWRNRVKRILREIYRLNKGQLKELLIQKKKTLSFIIFSYKLKESNYKKVYFKTLENDVLELFESIKKEIVYS